MCFIIENINYSDFRLIPHGYAFCCDGSEYLVPKSTEMWTQSRTFSGKAKMNTIKMLHFCCLNGITVNVYPGLTSYTTGRLNDANLFDVIMAENVDGIQKLIPPS